MNEPLLVAPGGRWHFEAAADTRRNVKALKRVLVARVALYCDRAEDCCSMPVSAILEWVPCAKSDIASRGGE